MEESREIVKFSRENLEDYLSSVFGTRASLISVRELGAEKSEKELKGFGYGRPYLIEFKIDDEVKRLVLGTVKPSSFGHEYFLTEPKYCFGNTQPSTSFQNTLNQSMSEHLQKMES